MENIRSALCLVKKGCWMASIDLKDAYYSVPIYSTDRKFLKFMWKGQWFQYTCLPSGLLSAPRVFTKLLKPVFSTLRKQKVLKKDGEDVKSNLVKRLVKIGHIRKSFITLSIWN